MDAVAVDRKQNSVKDGNSSLLAKSKLRKPSIKRNKAVVALASTDKIRKYECKHVGCVYATAYPKDLKRHARIHSGEKPYQCSTCERRFNRSDKLKVHERLHGDLKTYCCTKCNFKMNTSRSFKKHMRAHAEEASIRSECPRLTGECQYFVVNVNPETVSLLSLPSDENVGNVDIPLKANSESVRTEITTRRSVLMPSNSDQGNSERLKKKFACTYVDCVFISAYKKDLTRHMRIHSGEQPFECGTCKRRFNRSDKLKVHERSHSGEMSTVPKEKKYVCHHANCMYASAYRKDLRRHMQVHSREHPFQCKTCKRKFKRLDTFKLHERSHVLEAGSDNDKNDFQVEESYSSVNLEISRDPSLLCHKMIHIASVEMQNLSPKDEDAYSLPANLIEEDLVSCAAGTPSLKKAKTDDVSTCGMAKRYFCYFANCSFESTYSEGLATHLQIHSVEQPFPCATCDKKFNRLDELKLHKGACLSNNSFCCDKCSYIACTSKGLKKHILSIHSIETHSSINPQTATSPSLSGVKLEPNAEDTEHESMSKEDPQVTSGLTNVRNDSATVKQQILKSKKARRDIGEKKKHACEHTGCTFLSAYKKDLVRHLRVHSGEKPFECGTCKRKFNRSDKLKLHVRTHTGDKPYKREKRESALTCGSSLSITSTINSEENPYRCQLCLYTCRFMDQFAAHMTSHASGAEYSCKLCHCKFAARADLVQHELLHTSNKQFECPACKCALKGTSKMQFSLKQRIQRTKSHNLRWFPCPYPGCTFTGKSRQALGMHFLSHQKGKPPSYQTDYSPR